MTGLKTIEPSVPLARKYVRGRFTLNWIVVVLGLLLGAGAGLGYAWMISPVVEYDTAPWQLSRMDKAHYIVAIMLDYARDSDMNQAVSRLLDMRLGNDPIQAVADAACTLATTGYVESNSGLNAIRGMMTFYRLQNKSGCADTLIGNLDPQPTTVVEVVVPTATLVPPPTKTATPVVPSLPTATPLQVIVPTAVPQSDYVVANVATFCNVALSGLIEVYVQDDAGDGVPGIEVRVRWDGGIDRFFTGLKPERGPAYGDFTMEEGTGYVVDLPGRSDPVNEPLAATACSTEAGDRAITSYRVTFRPG